MYEKLRTGVTGGKLLLTPSRFKIYALTKTHTKFRLNFKYRVQYKYIETLN